MHPLFCSWKGKGYMKRIDILMRDVQIIQQSIKPSFFLAFAYKMKDGYRLDCQLHKEHRFSRVSSFYPDMEGVKKRIADMREKYPTEENLILIIDNVPEEGYNERKENAVEAHLCYRC